jgi:hypothetical protein
MKTNVFFFILISVLLTLNLCTQTQKPEPAGTAQTRLAAPANNPDTISKDSAVAMMARWEMTRDSIDKYLDKAKKGPGKKNQLDSLVVKGFFIPMGELTKIVARHAQDSIWAMLVIKEDPAKGKKPAKNRAGLIFMCYSKDGGRNAVPSTGELTFYDFTMPCPDECLMTDN